MNIQDYLPVPSIPIHYHKVIFLAASEKSYLFILQSHQYRIKED